MALPLILNVDGVTIKSGAMAVGLCEALPLQGSFTLRECRLFVNHFRKHTTTYLEYGCGVSTVIAALRAKRGVSIEGNPDWYKNTSNKLYKYRLNGTIEMRYADIGPTGWLSYPMLRNASAHAYCARQLRPSETFDLVLIDGRFRVACSAYVYRHLNEKATLLVHDSRGRRHYSDILKLYSLVGFVQSLAVFKPKTLRNPNDVYTRHLYDVL